MSVYPQLTTEPWPGWVRVSQPEGVVIMVSHTGMAG